jgi:alpha/beta superfamily hydrolase
MLHEPATAPRAAAVVCHPHPQYGGDMDNGVVVAVTDALVDAGVAALRFNFGGAGRSTGSFDDGRAEQCDVGAAEAALAARVPEGTPLVVVGYSFGAWVGAMAAQGLPRVTRVVAVAPPLAFFDWDFAKTLRQPLRIVVGDRDQYCPAAALDRLVAHGIRTTVFPGVDHFFGGVETWVGRSVVELLMDA